MFKIKKPLTTATFPYSQKLYNGQPIPEPTLALPIKTPLGYLTIKFLLDSGADLTILPINPYADLFNIKIDPTHSIKISGISRSVNAYPATITLKLNNREYPLQIFFAPIRTMPLLGRLDIWQHFNIHFNNQKNRTELTPIT